MTTNGALLPGADKAAHPRRPPRPRRQGVATSKATGPSFIALSESAGVAIRGPHGAAPFYGPGAEARKAQYAGYEFSAQACIMAALAVAKVASLLTRSVGSAPELVTLGFFFQRGYVLDVDIAFQTASFKDATFNPSGHPFPVDILTKRGDPWYLPVDGNYFHLRAQTAVLHDLERNALIAAGINPNHVLPIIDVPYCQSAEALGMYLAAHGVL